ncbi:MAG: hypothetical protein FJ102_00275 [Deltaproteobacteria bacterium]|nr:hypothetical protein [Deltaproteobacteria bacterium]
MMTLLMAMACTTADTVVASEAALPTGAEELKQALRSFDTLRAWIYDPEVNAGGHFTDRYVVTVRADGAVVVDVEGQSVRFSWTAGGVTRDATRRISSTSADDPRWQPNPWPHWPESVQAVQAAVQAFRSPDLRWNARDPEYYDLGLLDSPRQCEIVPPVTQGLPSLPGHLFLEMMPNGRLYHIQYFYAPKRWRTLNVQRLEINPPLPSTWFNADAPELEFRFPQFIDGEPEPPLDPGFYAPGATPPPAFGNQPEPGEPPSPPPPPGEPPPGGSSPPIGPPPPPPPG